MQPEASRASAYNEGTKIRPVQEPEPSVQHIGLTVPQTPSDAASDLFEHELAHDGTMIVESAGPIGVNRLTDDAHERRLCLSQPPAGLEVS